MGMNFTRCLLVALALLVLGSSAPAVEAAGQQITAVTEPIGNFVVTVQVIVGIIATLLLVASVIALARSEPGAALVGMVVVVVLIVVMLKAPDIIASFGAQRAIAAPLVPVVITAGQQVLDALQTGLVHLGWFLFGVQGIHRGRRAARV